MTETGWLRNYIELLDDPEDDAILDGVKSIQRLLANNVAFSKRVMFLEQMESISASGSGIQNPLSQDRLSNLVRKGIVTAYENGDVTAEELFKLVHSVDGLEAFTYAFGQVPRRDRAECWAEIAFTPSYAPEVNLDKLLQATEKASLWDYVSKLANEWVASISTVQPALALDTAVQTQVRPDFNQESSSRITSLMKDNRVEKRIAIEYQCRLIDGVSTGSK